MDAQLPLAHLLRVDQLSRGHIDTIFSLAQHYQQQLQRHGSVREQFPQQVVAHLFFEPSTRTCNSFELAAMRLGAKTLVPSLTQSSLEKGETLADTLNNLAAMGIRTFVIRHTEPAVIEQLARELRYPAHILSAGAGTLHHPSQTLLDLYTIQQVKQNWSTLRVAIVGDLRHSRVAHSLITGLQLMGTHDIRLICPEHLSFTDHPAASTRYYAHLSEGLAAADVIVCLRLQRERLQKELHLDEAAFFSGFRLDRNLLQLAKPDAIVLHPGPINRECEITSDVADGPQSVILRQVENSIPIRMALLTLFQ